MKLSDSSAAKVGNSNVAAIASSTASFRQFMVYAATTLSSVISGTIGLIKNGAGTLTLSGNNTYTGTTTINAGTLKIQANAFLTTARNYTITSGAVLNLDGANRFATGNSTISGSGKLLITGGWFQGQATVSPAVVGNISLGSGGTIEIASNTTLYNGGWASVYWTSNLADLIVDGTLNVSNGRTVIVDALTGSGTIDKEFAGTVTLLVGVDNGTGTFSGIIKNTTGSIALTKNGTGTLTLSGNNTYSGATTISAGTLKLGSATGVGGASALTVNGGAFDLNGFNATVASVTAGNAAGTITNTASGSGTNTLTILNYNANLASLIGDGATAKTAVIINNNNAANSISNTNNTFSGGLTIAYGGTGGGSRLYQGSVTNTVVGGILTKCNMGTGTITIGASGSTSNAQLMLNSGSIYNNIVVNAPSYVDGGLAAFRIDGTGIQFFGTIIAGSSNVNMSSQVTGSATLNGQLTGTNGLLLKTPGGASSTFTLTLANTLNPTNNYSGNTTTATRTTIALAAVNQIPNGTGKGNVVNNGSLTLGGLSHTINGLSGSGTIDGVSGTPTLTVGDNDATGSFSGVIKNTAGTLSVTKIGTGSLTLTGVNTYSGTTTISNGSLIVSKTTGAITGVATFTTTALTVNFNNITPTTGATYQFFPGATSPTGLTITLTNAGGKTGTYNYTNSTLTIN